MLVEKQKRDEELTNNFIIRSQKYEIFHEDETMNTRCLNLLEEQMKKDFKLIRKKLLFRPDSFFVSIVDLYIIILMLFVA